MNAEDQNEAAVSIRREIERLYSSGMAIGEDGLSYSIVPLSVDRSRGQFVADMCRREHAVETLEIGMAWGLSTLFMLEALMESDVGSAHHVVMDPEQSSTFHNAALRTIRDLDLGHVVEFYDEPSAMVLPRLVEQGRKFDLAFIDGDHRFDGVFVDLFYVDRLLKPGGIAVFDDLGWDAVYLACRFAETNLGYEIVDQHPHDDVSRRLQRGSRPLIRAYRTPLTPVHREQPHFVPFFRDFVSNPNATHMGRSNISYQGLVALRQGDRAAAREHFLRALRLEPFHFKTYLRLMRTYLPKAIIKATTGRTRAP